MLIMLCSAFPRKVGQLHGKRSGASHQLFPIHPGCRDNFSATPNSILWFSSTSHQHDTRIPDYDWFHRQNRSKLTTSILLHSYSQLHLWPFFSDPFPCMCKHSRTHHPIHCALPLLIFGRILSFPAHRATTASSPNSRFTFVFGIETPLTR